MANGCFCIRIPNGFENTNLFEKGLNVKPLDPYDKIAAKANVGDFNDLIQKIGQVIPESKFEISDGIIFKSIVTSIDRSENNNPGEKNANYYEENVLGEINKNTASGIQTEKIKSNFNINSKDDFTNSSKGDAMSNEELINYIMKDYNEDKNSIWKSEIFGRSLDAIVQEGIQSKIAIGSGGLTGMEWGQGVGKFWYLPEAHTDFAFAIFCQENGFLGAVVLILAYSILAMAFIRVCRDVKDSKAFLLSYGITFLVIGQAAANMCMVTGIFPVIGVPLPFISYGGSSMAVTMAAIGLFISIYNEESYANKIDSMTPEERRENIHVYRGGWHS